MARAGGGRGDGADDEEGAPDPIDIEVGSRIRVRRLLLGINQQALAKKLGLTFQQVQKYENGANRVSASRLAAIAGELHVSVDYFFEDLPDPSKPIPPEEALWRQRIRDSDVLELVRSYYAIRDPGIREQFLGLIKATAAAGRPG